MFVRARARTPADATRRIDRSDFADAWLLGSPQSRHGESDPAASNDAPHGKARDGRVEVLVRN